jgi:hypothetical protein
MSFKEWSHYVMSRLFLLGAMDKMSIFAILQEGVYMNTKAIYTKP